MAERRMFTKKVTDDDHFQALSASAQALYLHLTMSADDDGFCNQVSVAMFKAHASVQDLEALIEKRYIYQFESGVIVIKHWRMANALRKDRYTRTTFLKELEQLRLNENGSYTMLAESELPYEKEPALADNGCQVVAACLTQDRIGKDSIDKVNNPPTPQGSVSNGSKGFEKFWAEYPRKVGKEAAKRAFAKVKVPVDTLLAALQQQKASEQWKRGYIPNPATWLNQGRWEDEVETQGQQRRPFVATEFAEF